MHISQSNNSLFLKWFRNSLVCQVKCTNPFWNHKVFWTKACHVIRVYLRVLEPICVICLSFGDMGSSSCNYQIIWKLEQERSSEFLWMSVREIYELFKCPKVICIRWGVIGMFSVQITVRHMPLHDFLPWPLNEVKLYVCEGV